MNYKGKNFIVGIDLGTTNCAVTYIDLNDETNKRKINLFKIPQQTELGEISNLPVLPSFLYIPGDYDINKDAISLPYCAQNNNFVGAFAQQQGSNVPKRLVSSAKSWLCHGNVDRNAKILPWGSDSNIDMVKISPVDATSSYLKHIKKTWNSQFDNEPDDEDKYLENQIIIITIPASFDEVARDLTVSAANLAGLKNITLIEEPLAAFYSWLISHENNWQDYVLPNELILVCDVGGGTTDFTLISLKEVDGSPNFERIAVGDHLVLGGDNIDLSLARKAELFLNKKISLNQERLKSLCHQCRHAKEELLDNKPYNNKPNNKSDKKKITLIGKGSSLIANTISVELNKKEVEDTILEGFFPIIEKEVNLKPKSKKGITEFGLPYESEPSITLHIGRFLERHSKEIKTLLNKEKPIPDLILFNGGSLKPKIIKNQIRTAIRKWFNEYNDKIPRVLDNPKPDLAVSYGASYYGLVKIGKGVRVGSGSARSYYVRVQESGSRAQEEKQAICVVERGLQEGSAITLPQNNKFEVIANCPVSFDVYSSSFRSGDRCGDIIDIDDTLTRLAPIQTVITFGKKQEKRHIPVNIEAIYTEVGTLALWCKSLISTHKWNLQFQLRKTKIKTNVFQKQTFDQEIVNSACKIIHDSFSNKSKIKPFEGLVKDISKITGKSKGKWPLSFIRTIADELIKLIETKSYGPEFETKWLNLVGYCLRPGFGDGFDENRIQKIWKIHQKGLIFPKNVQSKLEWQIMWRRIAGGLTAGQQRQFFQQIFPIINARKQTKVKLSPQEKTEIWMALANMERLLTKDKLILAKILLKDINPKKMNPQYLWAISRFGARKLLYGHQDKVIEPNEVSKWIKTLMSKNWNNPKPVFLAITQLSKKTQDRMLNINDTLTDSIITWMQKFEKHKDFVKPLIKSITEVVQVDLDEENIIFGESLPKGLIITKENS